MKIFVFAEAVKLLGEQRGTGQKDHQPALP